MNNEEIITAIKNIFQKYILKDVNDFSLNDYNNFEKAIWALKDKYHLADSPFLLLPDPAKDADLEMMNATNDGFTEPDLAAKKKYLAMMQESYSKLCKNSRLRF